MDKGSRSRLLLATVLLAACALASSIAFGQNVAAAGVGQAIDVRDLEGNSVSPATVVKREPTRVLVKYDDDGTTAWVSIFRVRDRVGNVRPAGGAATAPATAPAAPPKKNWADRLDKIIVNEPGYSLEVKRGDRWCNAKVFERRGDWTLVYYPDVNRYEWVEPWRLRKNGERGYDIEFATPNRSLITWAYVEPPRRTPGEGPDPAGILKPSEAPPPPAGTADAATVKANLSALHEVSVAPAPWTYRPPAVTPLAPGRVAERAILLPTPAKPAGATVGGNLVRTSPLDVAGPFVMLAYQDMLRSRLTKVDVVDLQAGEVVRYATFGGGPRVTSVAPGGIRMAAFGGDDKSEGRVTVFDMPPSATPKAVVAFDPYAGTDEYSKDLADVRLIDNAHLYTLNAFNGRLIVWEFAAGSAKAVWTAKLPRHAGVALSPDRRTLAIAAGSTLALFDAVAGTPLGGCEVPAMTVQSMGFRFDGKRLAVLSGAVLVEFDLEAGKPIASLGLPAPLEPWRVLHLEGETVALLDTIAAGFFGDGRDGRDGLDGSTGYGTRGGLGGGGLGPSGVVLLDVSRHAVTGICKLDKLGKPDELAFKAHFGTAGGKLMALTAVDDYRALNVWTLPPKGPQAKPAVVLEAVTGSAGGTRASLEIRLDADAGTRQSVRDAILRRIADRGWTLVEDGGTADLRVVVSTTIEKSRQEFYGSGPNSGAFVRLRETVDATEKIMRVAIEVEGKTAWRADSATASSLIVTRPGVSSTERADASGVTYDFGMMNSVTLPETVLKPIEALPDNVPTYTLTNGGVRPN